MIEIRELVLKAEVTNASNRRQGRRTQTATPPDMADFKKFIEKQRER